jgi:hypothetical protein
VDEKYDMMLLRREQASFERNSVDAFHDKCCIDIEKHIAFQSTKVPDVDVVCMFGQEIDKRVA